MADLSLLPLPLNIKVVKSTTRGIRLTLQDADGDAIDLTGDTVTLTVKEKKDEDAEIVYQLNASHLTPLLGITDLIIPKTADFGEVDAVKTYYHEIRLIESGGSEYVWWTGAFVVHPTPGTA